MKQIESHLTTTEPAKNNKIWLNSDKTNVPKNQQNSNNVFDQPKLSKGKWNSNKQNAIGNEENFEDKPSKSDKWNIYKEKDHLDDYFYWDSINNHVEKDDSKTSKKVGCYKENALINYKVSGHSCRKSINYFSYLMHSRNFPLQVEVLVIVKFVFGYLQAFSHFRYCSICVLHA